MSIKTGPCKHTQAFIYLFSKFSITQARVWFPSLQTETVEEVKKPQAKKQTSRNHHQRLENIVKQTVVESKVSDRHRTYVFFKGKKQNKFV